MVLSPSSACFILKAPDPRPVPWELLRLGAQSGEGHPPPASGPRLLGSIAAASAAASSGQPLGRWEVTSDPWWRKAPQRMSGAERSLVTVGRSFTVAKGFVPRGKSSGGCCSQDISFLTSLATPVLPMLLRRLPGVGVGLGARLGPRLWIWEMGVLSQYSTDAAKLPGRSRRSSRLWLPRSG